VVAGSGGALITSREGCLPLLLRWCTADGVGPSQAAPQLQPWPRGEGDAGRTRHCLPTRMTTPCCEPRTRFQCGAHRDNEPSALGLALLEAEADGLFNLHGDLLGGAHRRQRAARRCDRALPLRRQRGAEQRRAPHLRQPPGEAVRREFPCSEPACAIFSTSVSRLFHGAAASRPSGSVPHARRHQHREGRFGILRPRPCCRTHASVQLPMLASSAPWQMLAALPHHSTLAIPMYMAVCEAEHWHCGRAKSTHQSECCDRSYTDVRCVAKGHMTVPVCLLFSNMGERWRSMTACGGKRRRIMRHQNCCIAAAAP